MEILNTGDVVQLKSGGTLLTVETVYDDGSVDLVFYSARLDNIEKVEVNKDTLIKFLGEVK